MALKIIKLIAPEAEQRAIARIAKSHDVVDWWRTCSFEDERFSTRLVVRPSGQRDIFDELQQILDRTPVSYPAMILALASGAAAVVSLTSGAAAGLVR
ncbi:MAG TPA: hypothetical protein ENM98_02415 [Halothiobacillaceae bacterium]|nr:hypothetical protein [Halothiobacillaceae bacterium]